MTFYRSRVGHGASVSRLAPPTGYRSAALGSFARGAAHRALSVGPDGISSDMPGASISIEGDGETLVINEVDANGEVTDTVTLPITTTPAQDSGETSIRSVGRKAAPRQVNRMSWERNPADGSVTFTPADDEVLDVSGDALMALVTALPSG